MKCPKCMTDISNESLEFCPKCGIKMKLKKKKTNIEIIAKIIVAIFCISAIINFIISDEDQNVDQPSEEILSTNEPESQVDAWKEQKGAEKSALSALRSLFTDSKYFDSLDEGTKAKMDEHLNSMYTNNSLNENGVWNIYINSNYIPYNEDVLIMVKKDGFEKGNYDENTIINDVFMDGTYYEVIIPKNFHRLVAFTADEIANTTKNGCCCTVSYEKEWSEWSGDLSCGIKAFKSQDSNILLDLTNNVNEAVLIKDIRFITSDGIACSPLFEFPFEIPVNSFASTVWTCPIVDLSSKFEGDMIIDYVKESSAELTKKGWIITTVQDKPV